MHEIYKRNKKQLEIDDQKAANTARQTKKIKIFKALFAFVFKSKDSGLKSNQKCGSCIGIIPLKVSHGKKYGSKFFLIVS